MDKIMYCNLCERNVKVKENFSCGIVILCLILVLVFFIGLFLLVGYLIYYYTAKPYKCSICKTKSLSERKLTAAQPATLSTAAPAPAAAESAKRFCPNCGGAVTGQEKFCSSCGSEI